ncbi:MFS transporter [Thalassoroseus pseudoceratinae]|uniref:MFS transporter n=1 Tax=Thalassoroseus pseudoceratinae TaxID=2713176 RepID=UPI00141E8288|nr:MFS transporter [Thalassoroseus pseudoceratinae]
MTDENNPDYVLVTCRVCGTRMHPDLRETAYEVKCHDCFTPAPVPSRAEVIAKLPKANRQKPDVGTYSLSLPPDVRDSLEMSGYGAPSPVNESPRLPVGNLSENSPPEDITFSEYGLDDESSGVEAEPVAEPDRNAFVVRCPSCDTPFAPTLINQPQIVLCPECLEDVPVPAESEVPKQTTKKRMSRRKSTPKQSVSSSSDAVFDAEEIPFEAEAPKSRANPSRRRTRKKKRKTAERSDRDSTDDSRNPTTTNREAVGRVFDRMAEIRQVGVAPPPRWTFFSGTLSFPWRPETWFRWSVLSVALTLSLLLMTAMFLLYSTQQQGGILGVAFLAMPTFWILMGALAYAASGGLCILIETASGSDRIDEWPERDWKEWAGSLVFVVFQLFVANVMAFFLGRLIGMFLGTPWAWTAFAFLLIAPVVLLSSLEANHPLTPLTVPILRTLIFYPQGWLLFHLVTGGWVLGMALVGEALLAYPFFAAFLLGPMLAAFLMVYPRMLGRLAWGASTMLATDDESDEDPPESDAPQRKKKRRKKKRLPPPSE